jgi:hypothetical protein
MPGAAAGRSNSPHGAKAMGWSGTFHFRGRKSLVIGRNAPWQFWLLCMGKAHLQLASAMLQGSGPAGVKTAPGARLLD